MTDVLLTWLCSYLLHSSLLIGTLWALERTGWLARLATSTQETLWRLALLGGLVSASLPLLAPAPIAAARPVVLAQQVQPLPVDPSPVLVEAPPVAAPSAQLGALPIATSLAPKAHDVAIGFVALWLAGALLMLAGLGLQWAWLRRAVRRLPELADPRWQGQIGRAHV